MKWFAWLRRARLDDLSDEVQSHIEEKTDALIANGLSRADAEREARRAFGNVTHVRDVAADVWRLESHIDSLRRDTRHALRGLIHKPGYTLAVVLTLALGIGANAVVFALVNAIGATEHRVVRRRTARLDLELRRPRPERAIIDALRAALEQRATQWKAELRSEPKVARLLLRRLGGPLTLWEEADSGRRWDAPVKGTSMLEGWVHDGSPPRGAALLGLTATPPKTCWMLPLATYP